MLKFQSKKYDELLKQCISVFNAQKKLQITPYDMHGWHSDFCGSFAKNSNYNEIETHSTAQNYFALCKYQEIMSTENYNNLNNEEPVTQNSII